MKRELAELGEAEAGEDDIPGLGRNVSHEHVEQVLPADHAHHGVNEDEVVFCHTVREHGFLACSSLLLTLIY